MAKSPGTRYSTYRDAWLVSTPWQIRPTVAFATNSVVKPANVRSTADDVPDASRDPALLAAVTTSASSVAQGAEAQQDRNLRLAQPPERQAEHERGVGEVLPRTRVRELEAGHCRCVPVA